MTLGAHQVLLRRLRVQHSRAQTASFKIVDVAIGLAQVDAPAELLKLAGEAQASAIALEQQIRAWIDREKRERSAR